MDQSQITSIHTYDVRHSEVLLASLIMKGTR